VDNFSDDAQKPLNSKTKVLYGVGAFGYGSISHMMGSFLMFFGTGILGIPGALMGIAVALGTVMDAATDPFVGHFSDKTKSSKFGKRHGFILFGCIAVALFNILIWSINPMWSTGLKFGLLLALLLVIEALCTFYSTPYQALGLDISKTYEDRTAVQGYRTVFAFSALLVPSILMSVFLSPGRFATMSASAAGYRDIAIVTSILCVFCGLITFLGTYKYRHSSAGDIEFCNTSSQVGANSVRPPSNSYSAESFVAGERCSPLQSCSENTSLAETKPKDAFSGIFADFFSTVRQKNVGRIILGYAISLAAAAFLTGLGLHIFTFTFQFTNHEIPFVMIALILGIIVGQPLWFFISRKTDKARALVVALCVVLFGMLIFGFVLGFRNTVHHDAILPLVSLTIFICGLGTGCLYSMPISMFADCIELERQRTGVDKTAMSAGFLTFCTKISNALIMFIIGVSLDLIGFQGGRATQSLVVQNWLGWLLIVGVTIASVCALIVYSGYSYSKKDFEKG